jgi:gluconate 2-dehydrogenase subunit 3-like protein
MSDAGIGRRALLQTLAGSAASAFALPALASGHPITEHLHDQAKVTTADSKARATNWKPAYLDQHQVDTVRVLAEKIVPGSTTAKSTEFIDSLLAVDSEQSQRAFLQALGAFEGLAIAQAKKPWKSLSDADQIALLTKASTAAPGAPPDLAGALGPRQGATAGAADRVVTIRDHFDVLKGWISGAYYSSEAGMRELGWTGTVMHEKFVGCEHGTH